MSGDGPILVVDDSPATLEVLRRNLEGSGFSVRTASGVLEALEVLQETSVALVITDVKMPKISGLDLVRHVRENLPETEVMVITGYPTVEDAVSAMKIGADEYLTKPFTDEELLAAVRKALDKVAARRETRANNGRLVRHPHGLVGTSSEMQRVYEEIDRASRTRATVLISGESGTGKELVARAMHYASDRAAAPFVPVNCGGIPESLLEAELFGHVKGAFTGASAARAGFFLTADGGTLFLDEIAETSLTMQVRLLRVLQEREVCMVGSSRPRKVDVRIIAATNKNLENLVRTGGFREDLFFRIHVLTIQVSPLRERGPADIRQLLTHFARKLSEELGRSPPRFSERALSNLTRYEWPGNVRELENVVQRLVVMTDGDEIDAPDLPALMRFALPSSNQDLGRTLAEVEADYVQRVLAAVDGNKSRAAEILGIDRKTLRSKLPPDGTTR